MLRLTLLAVFVSLAVAQTKFCCTPDQWEGYIGMVAGTVQGETAHLINGTTRLSYDYTDSMMAATSVITVDGTMQQIKMIMNYQKIAVDLSTFNRRPDEVANMCKRLMALASDSLDPSSIRKIMYIIVGTVCTPAPLTGDMKMCVPALNCKILREYCFSDNAVSTGKVYYGQSGSGLTADTYMFQIGQGLTLYASVTTTNPCLPIGAVMFGTTDQVGMVQSYGFVNSTTGIKDPSVFTPPTSCGSVKAVRDVCILDDAVVNYMNMMMTSA